MFKRLMHMLIKEFKQVLRDPRMKMIIFVSPLLQMVVFAFALTTDVTNIKTAVLDLDNTKSSRRLRPHTRTRTWAVYFLSRRGGGSLTIRQAIELWNHHMNDSLSERNFRSDRQTLLQSSSRAELSG